MRKDLKHTILDTVSTLRDLVKLHVSRESKADEISKLEKQVGELKAEVNECRHRAAKVLGKPSSGEITNQLGSLPGAWRRSAAETVNFQNKTRCTGRQWYQPA
jgi:hypothetical protein